MISITGRKGSKLDFLPFCQTEEQVKKSNKRNKRQKYDQNDQILVFPNGEIEARKNITTGN